MKKLLILLLAFSVLLCLASCGEPETDPNAGLYEARTGSALGISVDVKDVVDEFSLELKPGGKATLYYDGGKYGMKWSLDGEAFHAEGGGAELDGTLKDGVMVLQNVLDSGVEFTLVCDALAKAAPAPAEAELRGPRRGGGLRRARGGARSRDRAGGRACGGTGG